MLQAVYQEFSLDIQSSCAALLAHYSGFPRPSPWHSMCYRMTGYRTARKDDTWMRTFIHRIWGYSALYILITPSAQNIRQINIALPANPRPGTRILKLPHLPLRRGIPRPRRTTTPTPRNPVSIILDGGIIRSCLLVKRPQPEQGTRTGTGIIRDSVNGPVIRMTTGLLMASFFRPESGTPISTPGVLRCRSCLLAEFSDAWCWSRGSLQHDLFLACSVVASFFDDGRLA